MRTPREKRVVGLLELCRTFSHEAVGGGDELVELLAVEAEVLLQLGSRHPSFAIEPEVQDDKGDLALIEILHHHLERLNIAVKPHAPVEVGVDFSSQLDEQ